MSEWPQVLADLKLAPRVEREGLFVRWAGKKRDSVDEVLVRELQVGGSKPKYISCESGSRIFWAQYGSGSRIRLSFRFWKNVFLPVKIRICIGNTDPDQESC